MLKFRLYKKKSTLYEKSLQKFTRFLWQVHFGQKFNKLRQSLSRGICTYL